MPAVDAVMASLAAHLTPLRAPGITVRIPDWGASLETLSHDAPWRVLSDRVEFRRPPLTPCMR